MQQHEQNHDETDRALARYRREQREFENHWLWRELNVTPPEFYRAVDDYVARTGIDRRLWRERVERAKRDILARTASTPHPRRSGAGYDGIRV